MELFDDELTDDEPVDQLVPIYDERLTREELRNARSRLRSQINRESLNSEKRAANAARDMLSHALLLNSDHYRKTMERERRNNAIAYGAAALASKVLNSLGVTVPVRVETHTSKTRPPVEAYTNFENINIKINLAYYDESNLEVMVKLLHNVKGIVYHEGGHVIFTHTFYDMVKTVHEARRVTFTDYGNFTATHNFEGKILQLAVQRGWITPEYYETLMRPLSISAVMQAWNILEDQRMETAMVNTSPVMARYFTEIVANNVIVSGKEAYAYPWIIGRTYLPKDVRQAVRSLAEAHPEAEIMPVMDRIVMQYRRSNDLFEMYDLCIEFAECLIVWKANAGNGGGGSPGEHGNSVFPNQSSSNRKPSPVPDPDTAEAEQPDGQYGQPGTTDAEGKESDGNDGNETDDKNNDKNNNESNGNAGKAINGGVDAGSSPGNTADRETNRSLREALDEAIKRTPSETNENEVSEFLSTVNDAQRALVMPDSTMQDMLNDEIARSVLVTNSMRDVLDKLVVQVDPSWVFYQEHGVLDPVAFEMREPGDSNYWSGLDGAGSNGHDIAITMLLDTSGSMGAFDTELSVAAMGIRKACEQLNIPCTIMTFNDDVRMVVEGDKDIGYVRVSAGGGTSISSSMHMIKNFRYGKTHHLVVILTDGEWGDVRDLRVFSDPGRHIMLIGFNIDDHYLVNKGADSRAVITDLAQLPAKVTHALAGYLM